MVPMTDTPTLINELAKLERPSWAPRLEALRRSGVPLNDGDDGGGEPAGGGVAGEGSPAGGSGGEGGGEPTGGSGGDEPKTFSEDYVKELRAENAKHRKRNKELEEAEQARKDAELSETERATKRADDAEKELTTLRREKLQRKVADEAGLDPELAEFLTGVDEDAMTKQAEKLAAKSATKRPAPKVPGGPQGEGGSGVITADEATRLAKEDPAKFNELFDKGEIPASALGGK